MRYSEQPLQTFRLRNFKAVRDSGVVKFTPLTVFIGNNGSGKSSLIEGLETFQSIVVDGLDEAMNRWRGFENVLNKARVRKLEEDEYERVGYTQPMRFAFRLTDESGSFAVTMSVNQEETGAIYIQEEEVIDQENPTQRNSVGSFDAASFTQPTPDGYIADGESMHKKDSSVSHWQFLNLEPEKMGEPRLQKRAGRTFKLAKDGSNIGDYLWDVLQQPDGEEIFQGIIETLRYVLPYAENIQPTVTTRIQRTIHLQLSEGRFEVPGWLLSTGTLRVLALLAVLRHPNPPPLLCIEEIENGLDPRTINLLVEEIQRVTQEGTTQVICTTHSPYFLDLLPLSSIIVVERDEAGQPTFTRPDEKALGDWARDFAPGQLYTMSQLTRD